MVAVYYLKIASTNTGSLDSYSVISKMEVSCEIFLNSSRISFSFFFSFDRVYVLNSSGRSFVG